VSVTQQELPTLPDPTDRPTDGPTTDHRRADPTTGLSHRIAPNWFAAVMGTGIIANAVLTLPFGVGTAPVTRDFAIGVWLLAGALLLTFGAATLGQWIHHRDHARSHHAHPITAHFYGAPPMAMLTVGAATLLVGGDLIGERAALLIAWALWLVGTATGLISAFAIPYRHFTGGLGPQSRRPDAAFGGWLMSVVPPMVSASTGAALLPHIPAGQPRLTMLLALYAMFGLTLIASILLIGMLWGRLVRHGLPPAKLVPTLWIVLGPLGQSVTAANVVGRQAQFAIADPYATALRALGVVYGVPVLGFALLWAAIAMALTVRTARAPLGLAFAPTWWAFTFPVGTCVTGAAALAVGTDADVLRWLSLVLFIGLLSGWLVAAWGSLTTLRPERTAPGPVAATYSI